MKFNDVENSISQVSDLEFQQVCDIIETHRTQALMAVNLEHLLTCWEVGAYVSTRLCNGHWGERVVRELADYIKHNHPELRGYSKSNIYNMVKFYRAYSSPDFLSLVNSYPSLRQLPSIRTSEIVQLAVGQKDIDEIVQPTVGQMPSILQFVTYTHHTIIISNCHTAQERLFYILYANHERLNKRQLEHVIASETYQNLLGGDNTNMSEVMLQQYPTAHVMFKDRLMLDFLALPP